MAASELVAPGRINLTRRDRSAEHPRPRSWLPRRPWDGEASLGVNRLCAKVRFTFLMYEGRAVKTATDRAADAIEAAETMFADEMGAT